MPGAIASSSDAPTPTARWITNASVTTTSSVILVAASRRFLSPLPPAVLGLAKVPVAMSTPTVSAASVRGSSGARPLLGRYLA